MTVASPAPRQTQAPRHPLVASPAATVAEIERTTRYRDEASVYAGVAGEKIEITSANPRNYHHAIADPDGCDEVTIDGKLFLPDAPGPLPTVIMVPGSLGVGPNHEMHAETLVGEGFAVCVIDPFGARAVSSTVANQTHYSFAASAFDVLATVLALRDRPELDPSRMAAQGHSRVGAAVAIASSRRFADAVAGPDVALAAAYGVYPWCGHQFADPGIGPTRFRAIIGDQDEWCSVQQGQVSAMAAAGGDATFRLVPGAQHSFDRYEDVHTIEEASVTPAAPTIMLADDGAMIDPRTGRSDPNLVDIDLFLYAIEAGYGRRGAAIGGSDDQPERFRADMLAFYNDL